MLARERPAQPSLDPGQRGLGDEARTLAFVVTLDAINFGSGWFPQLRKREGLSGYLSIAGALRERFEREGPFSASELERLRPEDCAKLFGQVLEPPVDELMALFAEALNDLGVFLSREHRGRFAGPVEEARGSAERLVRILAQMPLYRDVARYEGFEVPFYKRAQITCSDLAEALRGRGLGRFHDIDELTLFADNLVPHVLKSFGVLVHAPELAARIDAEQLIPSGSPEEVEIRAVALHARRAPRGLVRAARLAGAAAPARPPALVAWPECAREGASAPPHALSLLLMDGGSPGARPARGRRAILDAQFWLMLVLAVALAALAWWRGGEALLRAGLGEGVGPVRALRRC